MLEKHDLLLHYVILILIFLAEGFALYWFRYHETLRLILAILLSVSYLIWGIVHHMIHKDLYWSVVAEYFAVAALGLVVILLLLI